MLRENAIKHDGSFEQAFAFVCRDEDYMDDVEENDADPDVEREIDPRWKDLKKILDNN